MNAARGVPIEWHVAEAGFATGLENLFRTNGIPITVVHTPIIW